MRDWTGLLGPLVPDFAVSFPSDPSFTARTTLLNNASKSPAKALVLPTSAHQVSAVVKFALEHHLTLSVKGGGFNTAGWAVAGDIILDLSEMSDVRIDTPGPTGKALVPPLRETPVRPPPETDSGARGTKRAEGGQFEQPASEPRRRALGADAESGSTTPIPVDEASSPALRKTRSGSRGSSSSDSRSPSGGEHSEQTEETSGPSRDSASAQGSTHTAGKCRGKGKGRATDADDDRVSEGTRSWVADQASTSLDESHTSSSMRPSPPPAFDPSAYFAPSGPSFATAFPNYPLPPTPASFPSFTGSGSSGSGSGGPSNGGFVFNSAALAPSSASPTLHVPTLLASPPPSTPSVQSSRSSSSAPSATAHALVTLGAGARSKALDAATAPFDYYIPLAAYPSGCAIFMSGGFGYLSRLHGLSMDNVVEAELVLPDGRIVFLAEDAPDDETKELWWAFRGAGLAMGIVTRLRVKAFRVGLVFSGNLIYPFNPATTPSLIKHWRDCCKNAPREAYLNLILTAGPDDTSHVVVIQVCYLGDRAYGDQLVQAIMSWEGERCLLKDFEMRTFLTQQESASKVLRAQAGNRWCIRADLILTLPDEVIHTSVTAFRHIPEGSAWLFEIAGGAIADAAPEASCFPQRARAAPFNVAAIHQWRAEADDDVWKDAARRWIDGTMAPHSAGGSFPCFIEGMDSAKRVRGTFGERNWKRLEAIKSRLDPQGVLPHTFWPKEGDEGTCHGEKDKL